MHVNIKKSKCRSLVKKQRGFVYISDINLGWKWLALVMSTIPIIQLSPRKSARYGFDKPNHYQKNLKQKKQCNMVYSLKAAYEKKPRDIAFIFVVYLLTDDYFLIRYFDRAPFLGVNWIKNFFNWIKNLIKKELVMWLHHTSNRVTCLPVLL